MRVFVTGGTGLVGTRLIRRLRERGDEVVLLSRKPHAGPADPGLLAVVGDPSTKGPWMDAVGDCDAVVNLVGESIFTRRWNEEFKQTLIKSRLDSTRNVVEAMKRSNRPNRVLVSASAIGWYGPHGDEELTEESPPASDFMARLCVDWEQAAREAQPAGIRVVLIRIGVVLDPKAGALAKMLTPFKMGVGGPVGGGQQFMSWIHLDDLVGVILHALDRSDLSGPMNGTAPTPVTSRDFAMALGKALGRPSFLPTPVFALKLMLGEVADVVTNGQRVLPKKALETGYRFRFPELGAALADLLRS